MSSSKESFQRLEEDSFSSERGDEEVFVAEQDKDTRYSPFSESPQTHHLLTMAEANKNLFFHLISQKGIAPYDAEDVYQESLIKGTQNINRYTEERGTMLNWFCSILVNTAIDERRKHSRRPPRLSDFDAEKRIHDVDLQESLSDDDPHEYVEVQELNEVLQQGINELPVDQKQAFIDHHMNGLTHKEIAEKYSLSLGTVKTRLRLALKKLNKNEAIKEYYLSLPESGVIFEKGDTESGSQR